MAAPSAPVPVQQAPAPAPVVQPPPNFLDDDDMPSSSGNNNGGGNDNFLESVTPVLTALSGIDLSSTPVLQPQNVNPMSSQQNLLNQLYAN